MPARKAARWWRGYSVCLACVVITILAMSASSVVALQCDLRSGRLTAVGRVTEPAALNVPAGALRVASSSELAGALLSAADGQTIAVADGVYDIGWVKVPNSVRVMAENLWVQR